MNYSKISTIRFAINIGFKDCLTNLNNLISKEGCQEPLPFFEIDTLVLDTDCIESKIARRESRNNNKSMDSAFICKDASGNQIIIFAEFRFNYKSMKHLKAKDLRAKKKYSTKNFTNLGYNNIHDKYYYIFEPNLKQQARRYFRSLYPSMPNNFKPITIADLKDLFF